MKSREYERRLRALEEQLQADLNLIRAGYEAKRRALELIWLASDGKDEADSAPGSPNASEAPPRETVPGEMVQSETVPSETVRTETPAQAQAGEVPRRDLLNDLLDVLPGLPEVFEKRDIYQALGYVPPRATLYRAIGILSQEKKIAIARYSQGGKRTQYRKLAAEDAREQV